MTEDEMVEGHHGFDGHDFEQAPGVGDGQGSLACGSPWGCKELDTTERLHFHFTFMRWRREWHPTPVFLPGESQGQESLVGCCLGDCTESDTTETELN